MLFAEFYSEAEVGVIKKNAVNIRTSVNFRPKIVSYIPRSLQEYFNKVEDQAFILRRQNLSETTRILVTDSNFELI